MRDQQSWIMVAPARALPLVGNPDSEDDHGPHDVAGFHSRERFVDLLGCDLAGDQLVELELTALVEVE